MKIGIIGGGASGMAAAITAAQCGSQVTILEQNERVGNKLLVTGNGKCNLSNLHMTSDCYHSDDPERLWVIFKQFPVPDTLAFFHRIGLLTKEKNGAVYPWCEQASAVLDVLRFTLDRSHVTVENGCRVTAVKWKEGRFLVHTKKDCPYEFDRIILSCGSAAGLKKGTKENGLDLAGLFSIKQIPFTPALVQLRCKEKFFKALAGVRCQAQITLLLKEEKIQETGELQLTDYGISGIPVFQLSRYAAKALPREKELPAVIDFLPQTSRKEWSEILLQRRKTLCSCNAEQFFTGTVHKKIAGAILKECNISPTESISDLPEQKIMTAGRMCRQFPVTVTGTNAFAQAQVCAGGVRLTEVTDFLEAKKRKGLYLTGELLDADGRCGGYNLQWAWSTGIIAGRAAAGRRI